MTMPLAPDFHTAEMVRAMPDDGNRYEVVWGELLVTPPPTKVHQRIVGRLLVTLNDYCNGAAVGEPFHSPADISWGPDVLVQPDLFVLAPEHTGDEWPESPRLPLVIEVLSPTTALRDRFRKRKLYQDNGVELLWLVDPERRLVESWTPEAIFPVVEPERLAWHPAGAAVPLVIEFGSIFG